MSNRFKILISVVGVVLTLAVITLSAGLVLTASSVNEPTSMAIGYRNRGTKCSIVASGMQYDSDTDLVGEEIPYVEGFAGDISLQKSGNGYIRFSDVVLSSSGMAVYTFTITNLSNKETDWLCYSVDIKGMTEDDNITVKLGTSVNTAVEDDYAWYSVGKNGATHTFVIIMSVTNPSLDALLDATVNITISYA